MSGRSTPSRQRSVTHHPHVLSGPSKISVCLSRWGGSLTLECPWNLASKNTLDTLLAYCSEFLQNSEPFPACSPLMQEPHQDWRCDSSLLCFHIPLIDPSLFYILKTTSHICITPLNSGLVGSSIHFPTFLFILDSHTLVFKEYWFYEKNQMSRSYLTSKSKKESVKLYLAWRKWCLFWTILFTLQHYFQDFSAHVPF